MKKILFLISMIFLVACGNNPATDEGTNTKKDTVSENVTPEATSEVSSSTEVEAENPMSLSFKTVNAYEGMVSLVFEDENGDEYWFDYYDIDPEQLGFYSKKTEAGAATAEYIANPEKMEKQFNVHYRLDSVKQELTGEIMETKVITEINEL